LFDMLLILVQPGLCLHVYEGFFILPATTGEAPVTTHAVGGVRLMC